MYALSAALTLTTQAREGIETCVVIFFFSLTAVTTQAREGIETPPRSADLQSVDVTTHAREGSETCLLSLCS